MKSLVIFAVFFISYLALANGLHCTDCPFQLEGTMQSVSTVIDSDGAITFFDRVTTFSIDRATGQVYASETDTALDGTVLREETFVANLLEGVVYGIIGDECEIDPGNFDLPPFLFECLTADLESLGSSQIGEDQLEFDSYAFSDEFNRITFNLIAAGDGKCLPLDFVHVRLPEEKVSNGFSQTTNFVNLSTGVADPSVFDVPSICLVTTEAPKGVQNYRGYRKYYYKHYPY